MKRCNKDKAPLKVVVMNPPTKEEARTIINNISKELTKLYSQNQNNELEDSK